jgi:hypothetical protein
MTSSSKEVDMITTSMHDRAEVSSRVRGKSKTLAILSVLVAVVAMVPLTGSGTAAGPNTIAVTKMDTRALGRFTRASLGDVSLLKTLGERSYYRIRNTQGPDCYGVGPAEPRLYRLGQIQCAPDFPSVEKPVLDFTILHGNPNEDAATVFRSEGFAADGIADLVLQGVNGETVGVMPVVDNVYSLTTALKSPVATLAARDSSGTAVWTQPLAGASARN